jgi:hypothetical protein
MAKFVCGDRINHRRMKMNGGLAIVEFTVVVGFFMILFLTIVDLSVYGFVKLTMQHSVREGARYAITGRSDLDPDNSGNREAAILEKISESSNGLIDKVMDIKNIRVEDVYGNSINSFGGPGDIISIHLDCEWTASSPYIYLLLNDGKYQFTVSSAMKNEAF